MQPSGNDTTPAVRRTRPDDLGPAIALLKEALLPTEGVTEHFNDFFIVEIGDALAGVAGLECYGPHALLRSVAVRADQRGRGLGELLVRRCLAHARALHCADVWLLTTTADRWFPRFGFLTSDRGAMPAALSGSAELQGACPESAVVLRLTLD